MRAIDGDILEKKLKDAINMCVSIDTSGLSELKAVLEDVEKMPTIEPQRKKGKWINVRHDNIAECDQCGITGRAWMNFCFNCGADMREDGEEE